MPDFTISPHPLMSNYPPGIRPRLRVTIPLLGLALASSGCSIAGGYQIADHARMPRDYRTIAGSVQVGRNATIHDARTVAGRIEVGDGASTRSLNATAGEIRIGESAKIDGDVSALAGHIWIGAGTHVTGGVTQTSGSIELNDCRIDA